MSAANAALPPAPAPRRRGGGWWAARCLALVTLVVGGFAWAAPPADPCGPPGFIGLGSRLDWSTGGALEVGVVLTTAPVERVTVWPLLFVDGRLRADARPIALPCGVEVVEVTPPLAARHAVHWTLIPWPAVPPGFAALGPDGAAIRFAEREPPGLFPWTDVATLRPPGARPAPRAAAVPGDPIGDTRHGEGSTADGSLVDDRVELLGPDGAPLEERWARVPIGAPLPFRLRYVPSELGAGPVVATCLLDERQLAAFDGEVARAADLVAGEGWALDGVAILDRPGWHRLHCLLLPDDPGERPDSWPRPLIALYLWGDP